MFTYDFYLSIQYRKNNESKMSFWQALFKGIHRKNKT